MHALCVIEVPFECRAKKVLGFQRQAGSNQAQLQWQGRAPVYNDDIVAQDARPGPDHEETLAGYNADDAAMAAADNMDWDLL